MIQQRQILCLLAASVATFLGMALGDDEVGDVDLKPVATTPAEVDGPATQADPLGTMKEKTPAAARLGVVTLSNGTKIEGRVWTTLQTPLRIWVDDIKAYRDVDLAIIKKVEVKVLAKALEPDWRWLKEGSDQKIYSGKKYPNVELAYKFTLENGQEIEGAVVAPIYTFDGEKRRTLALYKKYHGKLDETLQDVVYVKEIALSGGAGAAAKGTRKLPLIY